MYRINEIDVKLQKEILPSPKYSPSKIYKKRKEIQYSDVRASEAKDDDDQEQISELLHNLPKLEEIFEVHRKIGEGTFSSVYLGSLKKQSNLPSSEKKWFAIKHLVPTSHPARIEHELKCLLEIGGKEHVIGVDLCLRNLDTIVFVMPYMPHTKFSECVRAMDAAEVRGYMRALLAALHHVHRHGVVHRDVKPSNFLYDRARRRYMLVDFGLAQRIEPTDEEPPVASHGKRARESEEDEYEPNAKRVALDLSAGHRGPAPAAPALVRPPPRCSCWGARGVCAACGARGGARAARAGTAGYRAPEVLLKVRAQGAALDVWAAGVLLGAALTGRQPLLPPRADLPALADLAHLLGSAPLQAAAAAHRRRLLLSRPSPGLCLRKLAARLRGAAPPPPPTTPGAPAAPACRHCRLPRPECVCLDDSVPATGWRAGAATCGFPDSAFGLAALLLQPDPRRRPSAGEALRHAFFTDPH